MKTENKNEINELIIYTEINDEKNLKIDLLFLEAVKIIEDKLFYHFENFYNEEDNIPLIEVISYYKNNDNYILILENNDEISLILSDKSNNINNKNNEILETLINKVFN